MCINLYIPRKLVKHLSRSTSIPLSKKLSCTEIRDAPLENLSGGGGVGGAGEVQNKYSRKGKLNEKNSCTPINPKKYSCYGLKKIHTRNLITKKIPAARKFPSPSPHNFCNGPSLNKGVLDPSLPTPFLSNSSVPRQKTGAQWVTLPEW